MFRFEWDEQKSKDNLKKHGVGFDEAKTVFEDIFSLTIPDPEHSIAEARFIDMGYSINNRLLVIVYTEHNDVIRIISCRKAENYERRQYESERF
ncbi:MAG: BrnT family toxin [Chloroflexi bacterium]|nr:BrnT family toxin [Chloroflexota bacterium]